MRGFSLNNQIKGNLITTKGNIKSMGASMIGIKATIENAGSELVLMAIGDEDLPQSITKKFKKVSSSILFSSYISQLTANADIVFPVHDWLEQEGHYINSDGHILESKAALDAPEGTLSSEESLSKLATVLKVKKQKSWNGFPARMPWKSRPPLR